MKPRLFSLFALAAWIGGSLPLSAQGDPATRTQDTPPPPAKETAAPAEAEKPAPEAKSQKPAPPEKPEKAAKPDKVGNDDRRDKRDAKDHENKAGDRGGVKRAYLGVVIASVSPPLAEHLGLTEGFGLQIEHIMDDSPAHAAKLQGRDILTKFDDQLLTTPEHLALLVRTKKGGDTVRLTFIRKGQEQTVETVLQEKAFPAEENRDMRDPRDWNGPYGYMPDDVRNRIDEALRRMHRGGEDQDRRGFDNNFHRPGDEGRQDFRRDNAEKKPPYPPVKPQEKADQPEKKEQPQPEKPANKMPEPPKPPVKPEPPVAPGKPPGVSVRPGFPVSVFAANSMVQINNQEGAVSIATKDGKHTITIKSKEGETVYDGDFDPAKGGEGLPEKAREILKQMKLDDLKVMTPPNPPAAPRGEGVGSPVLPPPARSEVF